MSDKLTFQEMENKMRNATKRAMDSRDPRLVLEMEKLDTFYEQKMDLLIKKAEKTMNPRLRKEWKKTQNEYLSYMNVVESKFFS